MTVDNSESAGRVEPGTPNTNASQPPVSPTSGSPDVGTLVKAILEHPDFQKQTQSVKDKRIAEIETSLTAQGGDLARLAAALNVPPEQLKAAQSKIALDDLLAEYQSGKLGQVTGKTPPGSSVDLSRIRQSIISETGLPENHAGLDDFIAGLDWNDSIAASMKVAAWATQQKATIRQPTPADTAPQTQGNQVIPGVEAEYKAKLNKIRRGDVRAISELKIEYRKKGLNV